MARLPAGGRGEDRWQGPYRFIPDTNAHVSVIDTSGEAPISKVRLDGAMRVGMFQLDLEEVSFSDVAPAPDPTPASR